MVQKSYENKPNFKASKRIKEFWDGNILDGEEQFTSMQNEWEWINLEMDAEKYTNTSLL